MTVRRFLGDLDAAADQRFEQHFVESDELARLKSDRSDIVFGSKGVGKTALRRALTELHESLYFTTTTIDLDQLSFEQVHRALSELRRCSNEEMPALARNTWRNVLVLYGLEALSEALPPHDDLQRRIEQVLEEEGLHGTHKDSTNRLLKHISKLLMKIGSIGTSPAPSTEKHSTEKHHPEIQTEVDLTIRVRSVTNEFPTNPAVRPLLEEAAQRLAKRGHVLVCLDGFDSIVDHSPESRRAIFAGLIDAIHKCARDPHLCQVFSFKAFLPQELIGQAHAIVWDADKFINNAHYLQWSREEFQRFMRQRLLPYAKTKSKDFLDVWSDFMPAKIANDAHGIEETAFDYILRHTLYRPRQLLAHMQRIFDQWDTRTRSSAFRVDPTFIPPVVARTNRELAQTVSYQLSISHPRLDSFMRSFSGLPNVMPAGEFLTRVRRIFECEGTAEKDIVDTLFTFGLFGLAKKGSVSPGSHQARFRFGFQSDSVAPTHSALEGSDFIAVSPMFHEYCGCVVSGFGPITPYTR